MLSLFVNIYIVFFMYETFLSRKVEVIFFSYLKNLTNKFILNNKHLNEHFFGTNN